MFQNAGPGGPVRVLSNALEAEHYSADLSSVSDHCSSVAMVTSHTSLNTVQGQVACSSKVEVLFWILPEAP